MGPICRRDALPVGCTGFSPAEGGSVPSAEELGPVQQNVKAVNTVAMVLRVENRSIFLAFVVVVQRGRLQVHIVISCEVRSTCV